MAGFEDWLRRQDPPPEPGEGFADELRKHFQAGFRDAPDSGVSRSRPESTLRKEDVSEQLESFLKQHASPSEAREGFRGALRERFTGGTWAEASPAPRSPRGRLLRWLPIAAGLAAAVLVLTFFVPRQTTTSWRLVSTDATARVSVGDLELDPAGTGFLSGLVDAEDGFVVADGNLRVAYGDSFRMEVQSGSRVALDRAGGSGLRLFEGEVFLQTLDDYPGEGLTVATPETLVAVHGTTLGVLAYDEGTCVCVLEGLVDVGQNEAEDVAAVATCCTRFVFRDETTAPVDKSFPRDGVAADPQYEAHLAPLRAFYDDAWR